MWDGCVMTCQGCTGFLFRGVAGLWGALAQASATQHLRGCVMKGDVLKAGQAVVPDLISVSRHLL